MFSLRVLLLNKLTNFHFSLCLLGLLTQFLCVLKNTPETRVFCHHQHLSRPAKSPAWGGRQPQFNPFFHPPACVIDSPAQRGEKSSFWLLRYQVLGIFLGKKLGICEHKCYKSNFKLVLFYILKRNYDLKII